MTRLKYIGPHDGVDLMLSSGALVTVARGDTAEIDAELAAALLEQRTNWAPAPPAKKATADTAEATTSKDGD